MIEDANSKFLELFKYMNNITESKDELNDIGKIWEQLILLSQLSTIVIDMKTTKNNFNLLSTELISELAKETLKKVFTQMESKAQVTVDIVIRNLFERTADIGFLATDEDLRNFLLELPRYKSELSTHKDDLDDTEFRVIKNKLKKSQGKIKKRFEEYVSKYSVYYDILLFDTKGNIVSKLKDDNTATKTSDPIFQIAKTTKEEYIESYKYHDFQAERKKSLAYTYKVTKSSQDEEIIGYLSLCFKFKDEMKEIFSKLIYKNNKEVILLLDDDCEVIESSDKYHIPLGAKLDIELDKPYNISQFAGRDYLIKTCKTNGYEGFYGLKWYGHIMIPLDFAFEIKSNEIDINKNILYSIMQNKQLFKEELLQIPKKAAHIQEELARAVWNGNITQVDSNTNEGNFARLILKEIKETGEKTKETFNSSIEKLNETIISSSLDNVNFLASLSMDIMDRNLYERANDCRWWALTSSFQSILEKASNINKDDLIQMTNILKYINSLYTVYTNILIYDLTGTILAVSNEKYSSFINSKLDETWISNTLNLKKSSEYCVSDFKKTYLYNDEFTYIYNSAIHSNNKTVGGIAIIFDSTEQFQTMLKDALPKEDHKIKNGIFSLFVDKQTKSIISCSDNSHKIGDKLALPEEFFQLEKDVSFSKIIDYNNKYYIIGSKHSRGYREYKRNDDYENDIISFVFLEAGNKDIIKTIKKEERHSYSYNIDKDEFEEIATFYIGNKWLGVRTKEIIKAISKNDLETPISIGGSQHFKGTISHGNYIVSVLDISNFIQNNINEEKNDIIIVTYDGANDERHTVGILIDKLGEIIKVPKKNIKAFEEHLITGGVLGESIVQPPENSKYTNLLTLLNLSKISTLTK